MLLGGISELVSRALTGQLASLRQSYLRSWPINHWACFPVLGEPLTFPQASQFYDILRIGDTGDTQSMLASQSNRQCPVCPVSMLVNSNVLNSPPHECTHTCVYISHISPTHILTHVYMKRGERRLTSSCVLGSEHNRELRRPGSYLHSVSLWYLLSLLS